MDSEDSRPGSSASISSSNSSQNSEQSLQYNDGEQKKENSSQIIEVSPNSSSGSRQSRRSDCLHEGSRNSCSKSKSGSDASSNTSLSDDDETKSSNNIKVANEPVSAYSESGTVNDHKRNLSKSPSSMSHRSSRDSSLSSNCCRSNSEERQQVKSEINMTHEDLSDVSDLESEKHSSVYNKIKSTVENENLIIAKCKDVTEFTEEISIKTNNHDNNIMDLRQKLEQKKFQSNEKCATFLKDDDITPIVKGKTDESLEDLVKTHDEDALDFEAEEGECQEINKNDEKQELNKESNLIEDSENLMKNNKNDKELEEGEVSDEDEKRPEETEPKPVCRFYTRGQCTWGMSCRFLHPGVTDKGNYTMFDLVRPVPLPIGGNIVGNRNTNYSLHGVDYHDYRSERSAIHHRSSSLHHTSGVYASNHEIRKVTLDGPVVVESAWERGLRTAKEMMRKANKRKEQDMDFEDKKMNLTLSPDELEKDPYYLKDSLSPTENTRHPLYAETVTDVYNPGERFVRGPPLAPHYDEVDPYGRSTRYRELPPHRMPQYEDDRRVRPAREVIVQRVDPIGRSDEWNDPWMRSKSPNGRGGSRDHGEKRRRERRSYSSNSSYSSSSSSQSDSSSDSSRSLSPRHRRRYNSISHKSSPSASRRSGRTLRSITPPPKRSKNSPTAFVESKNDLMDLKANYIIEKNQFQLKGLHQSPSVKKRGNISSPVFNRGSIYSPVHKRKRSSPLKKMRNEKTNTKHRHSSSSSDSDSTGSDSESDSASSSSESSSQSRDHTPPKRSRIPDRLTCNERKGPKKDLPKKRSPISIELKKPTIVGVSALTSPSQTPLSDKDSKKSRREELLKQLRAVEDAIAKKRSKLS